MNKKSNIKNWKTEIDFDGVWTCNSPRCPSVTAPKWKYPSLLYNDREKKDSIIFNAVK